MDFIIEETGQICRDHYLMKIKTGDILSSPGQFINIKINNSTDPLLRRPFSIHNHENNTLEIIFKVVGKGTDILRSREKNDKIDIIAPLGNGFTLENNKKSLLIGGGVGNAPLYYLAKKLKEKKNTVHFLYGARSEDCIYSKEKYSSVSDFFTIATDDGSEGKKGFITDILGQMPDLNSFDRIYICGPSPMMKNAMRILNNINACVEVSVENYFGCGIGLCSGCAVETGQGMIRACMEGPVIDGKTIIWD